MKLLAVLALSSLAAGPPVPASPAQEEAGKRITALFQQADADWRASARDRAIARNLEAVALAEKAFGEWDSFTAVAIGFLPQYLSSQGLNNIFTVTTPEKMMTMFQNQRINLLVASDVALPQMLAQHGMEASAVKRQLCFMQNQSYLAFSLQTDEAIVNRWQDSLQTMRADGSFARIHNRWFPGRPLPDAVRVETVPLADR